MSSPVEDNFPVVFPFLFVALWLTITTILGVLSGWFRLMATFPNQPGEPLLRVRGQSGSMALGIGMKSILTLSVCSSGLRVGITRVFGPFCRDFFVPWEAIMLALSSR